jgi:hypothetical protein
MVTTPSNVGVYQRYLSKLFSESLSIGANTGFQSIFGRPETGGETIYSDDAEVIDIDVQRGNKKTAVLVPRGGISRSLGSLQKARGNEKFSSFSRVYPLSIELYDIASGQLNKRLAGEPLYAPQTRSERLRRLAVKGMRETVRRTIDMFEILAAQSALTGKQDAIIGTSDVSLQYDWRRAAANSITVGTKWDATGADIMSNLDAALDKVQQNGHMRGRVAVVGASAMDALIKDSTMQTLSDNRRYELVQISNSVPVPNDLKFMIDNGFDPRGHLATSKGRTVWLFTYEGGYENSSGTWIPYMPVDQCLIFDPRARCDRYFGPPETLPLDNAMRAFYADRFGLMPDALPTLTDDTKSGIVTANMFYFDAYASADNTVITHRTQSAPIFGTTQVDAFALLKGLV